MKYKISNIVFMATLLLAIFIIYCLYLPNYIQGGDTAELVLASYHNLVAHPPGYPLWNLLQAGWIHTLPFKSIFWRAALLNTFFALGALFFVSFPLRRRLFFLLVVTVNLAFATSFFEAAVLPDVFALHAFFISVICYLYINKSISLRYRLLGISILFFLGTSNHHTVIFLFPVLADTFFESWSNKIERKWFFLGCFIGICLSLVLYLSLMLKNSSSYYSWNNIESLVKLWEHFARVDYGTFQLSADQRAFKFNFSSVFCFFQIHACYFIFLLGLLIYKLNSNFNLINPRKIIGLTSSALLSLLFLGMANFPIVGMGKEVVLRFHLMPLILIMFAIVYLVNILEEVSFVITRAEKFFLILLMFYSSSSELIKNKHLANDSIIESYSTNLLNEAKVNNANVIFSDNDNVYFSLRYVKALNPKFDNIAIVSAPLIFHEWYVKKLQVLLPTFKIVNTFNIFNDRKMDLIQDVLNPNIHNFSFVFTSGFQDSKNFKLTYLQLGRVVSSGSGVFFQEYVPSMNFDQKRLEGIFSSFQGFSKKFLIADYSHYYLAHGMNLYSSNNTNAAMEEWRKAFVLVPYCYPALINFCSIGKSIEAICTQENLEHAKRSSEFIF